MAVEHLAEQQPEGGQLWTSSWSVLLGVMVALTLAVPMLLGGRVDALGGLVPELAVLAAWLAGATALGHLALGWTGLLARDRTDWKLAVATCMGLGLGLYSLLGLGLGLLGGLSTLTAWGMAGVPLLLWALRYQKQVGTGLGQAGAWLRSGAGSGWLLVAWAPLIGMWLTAAMVMPGWLWRPLDPHPYDVLSYHLMVPREWYEVGRIVALQHNCFSYFPMNVEVQYLLGMHLHGGVYEGMYFSQFLMGVYAAIAGLAVAGLVSRLGGSRLTSVVAMGAVWAVPWTVMLGSVAYVETGVMAYSALALAWALAWGGNSGGDRWLGSAVLAGVFGGLAGGSKYTAIPMTLLLVPLAGVAGMLLVGRWKRAPVVLLIAWAAGVATVSPWLVRNVVWVGNPVYPLALRQLGQGSFTPEQVTRYERAHSATQQDRAKGLLTVGWERIAADGEFGYVLLPLAAIGLCVLLVKGNRETRAARVTLGIVIVGSAGIWLLATHLQPRFFAPVIPVLAATVGLAAGSPRREGRLAWPSMVGAIGGLAMVGTTLWFVGGKLTEPDLATGIGAGLLLLKDPNAINPASVAEALESGRDVALVGNAQPFLMKPVKGRQLRYSTVFDVSVPPGATVEDAWLGESVDDMRAGKGGKEGERGGAWVIVCVSELQRLSATYFGLPAPRSEEHWINQGGKAEVGNVVLPPR